MKKIISISNLHAVTNSPTIEELKQCLSSLDAFQSKEDYVTFLETKFRELSLQGLGLAGKFETLPVGFHTHQIFTIDKKELSVQFKVYITHVSNKQDLQGSIMVAAHQHKAIPDSIKGKTYQAVTYVLDAHGSIQVDEERFSITSLDGRNYAEFKTSTPRPIGSFNKDENEGTIHNFTATGDGRAAILVIYIASKDPNQTYFPELVTTKERAQTLHDRLEKGLTPYRPTSTFGSPFLIEASLREILDAETTQSIESTSIEALQKKVALRTVKVTTEILDTLPRLLQEKNLYEEYQSESVQVTLNPLLEAVKKGEISHFYISWKPETGSCEDSSHFRIQFPQTTNDISVGVDLNHEIRFNIREQEVKKGANNGQKSVHIYISPAHKQAAAKQMYASVQLDASKIGVVRLAINPFNVIDGLLKTAEETRKTYPTVHFHIDPEFETIDWVTNNAGDRHLSVSSPKQPYLEALKLQLTLLEKAGFKVVLSETKDDFADPKRK
jgi:hypothetical protein